MCFTGSYTHTLTVHLLWLFVDEIKTFTCVQTVLFGLEFNLLIKSSLLSAVFSSKNSKVLMRYRWGILRLFWRCTFEVNPRPPTAGTPRLLSALCSWWVDWSCPPDLSTWSTQRCTLFRSLYTTDFSSVVLRKRVLWCSLVTAKDVTNPNGALMINT